MHVYICAIIWPGMTPKCEDSLERISCYCREYASKERSIIKVHVGSKQINGLPEL